MVRHGPDPTSPANQCVLISPRAVYHAANNTDIEGEPMRRFEGRVAVVSGAAQGMGKAVALRLGHWA